MMKINSHTLRLFTIQLIFISCNINDSLKISNEIEVQNFIWKGLNTYYLWKEKIPDLNENNYTDACELNNYLAKYQDYSAFFNSFLYKREKVDKWSWIVDDYNELQNSFKGISKSDGLKLELRRINGTDELFAIVRYVLPNTSAFEKRIKRGTIIRAVNKMNLSVSNYRDLLYSNANSYLIELAVLNLDGSVEKTGETITITRKEYQENPVYTINVIEVDGIKIGYLLYNKFNSSFDKNLNDSIAKFKDHNIDAFVLDLRYNSGGSILTATHLASMLTGQFNNEVFAKEIWNPMLQKYIHNSFPEKLVNNFKDKLSDGTVINNLNLSEIYIITSNETASASELIINGLKAYIPVTIIGDNTVGKYVGSVTLYDSKDFSFEKVNPNHTWAMQPIVIETVNAKGENNKDGFKPDIEILENPLKFSQLGSKDEPLLNAAIQYIVGKSSEIDVQEKYINHNLFSTGDNADLLYQQMYKEIIP